jgi:hypothetical protein
MKFRSTVELGGKTATGIRVPAEIVARLGTHKRPPVSVTINGYIYRSTIAPINGVFMIPLSAEHRTGAGVEAGEEIEVDVLLDTAPRTIEIPEDFAATLEAHPVANKYFDDLSYSNQLRIVTSIESAKAADTRQRRIDKAIASLIGDAG